MATATAKQTKTIEKEQPSLLDEVIANTKQHKSVVSDAASVLGVEPGKLCDLLRNVWKVSKDQPPLTNAEMFAGLSMIARFELDPIAREVYVTRTKQGLATIVGIDGWVKILDRTDHYDGYEIEIHEDAKGNVDYVDCTIHSTKRKHPSKYRAFMKEYRNLSGFMADKIPVHMLRIFAMRHAARLFVPLGVSIVTEEEALFMDREVAPHQTQSLADLNASLSAPTPQEEPAKELTKQRGLDGVKEMFAAARSVDDIAKIASETRKQRELTPDEDNLVEEMCEAHRERVNATRGDAAED